MPERLHVFVGGSVQGVGFRFSTQRKAENLGLNGWVRNCHDGRVEAEFEGSQAALEEMLVWCRHGPAFARVTQVEVNWGSGPRRYAEFTVRG